MNDTDIAARARSRRNVQIARQFGRIERPGAASPAAARSSGT